MTPTKDKKPFTSDSLEDIKKLMDLKTKAINDKKIIKK
jgi:hypothetical protein